jgi:hypothetical protein
LFHLFCRKGKNIDYFGHYLDDHLCNCGSGRNLIVNAESPKEVFDAFKDIDKGVVTFPDILGRLAVLKVKKEWAGDNTGDTHGYQDIDGGEDRLCGRKYLEDRLSRRRRIEVAGLT